LVGLVSLFALLGLGMKDFCDWVWRGDSRDPGTGFW
jgi:hypothetical protein